MGVPLHVHKTLDSIYERVLPFTKGHLRPVVVNQDRAPRPTYMVIKFALFLSARSASGRGRGQ